MMRQHAHVARSAGMRIRIEYQLETCMTETTTEIYM